MTLIPLFLLLFGFPLLLFAKAVPQNLTAQIQPEQIQSGKVFPEIMGSTISDICKWGNCGETCPPGYQEIPRQGGAKGEIMSDHSHCENGNQRFCCPVTLPQQPQCTWRGFNKGRCAGECLESEVEVGSLFIGCKLPGGHQKACCSFTDDSYAETQPGLWPYTSCKWVSDSKAPNRNCAAPGKQAKCPGGYPKFLFAASMGFGGEDKCLSGAKSYCCFEIPNVFTNCKWVWNKNKHGVCEQSCPYGHIKLGMQTVPECEDKGGYAAYCCGGAPAGPSPSPSPSPSPTSSPPTPSTGFFDPLIMFQKMTKLIIADSSSYVDQRGTAQCPLEALPVWSITVTHKEEGASDLEASIDAFATSTRVPDQCAYAWNTISNFLKRMIIWDRPLENIDRQMIAVYNGIFSDPGLTVDSFIDNVRSHPSTNPQAIINDMLFDPTGFSRGYMEMKQLQANFCVPPSKWPPITKGVVASDPVSHQSNWTLVNGTTSVRPRHISNSLVETSSEIYRPTFGDILLGHITLYYARWLWYEGRETGNQQGPMLEMIYWIGTTPGVYNEQEDVNFELWRYRDNYITRGRYGSHRSRFVGLHFHFDGTLENRPHLFTTTADGRTSVGINAISMFHAAAAEVWRGTTIAITRDRGSNDYNSRSVIRCPRVGREQPLMHAGPSPIALWDDPLYRRLELFLTSLVNLGYLSAPSFRYIMHSPAERPGFPFDVAAGEPRNGWRSDTSPNNNQETLVTCPYNLPFLIRMENGQATITHRIPPLEMLQDTRNPRSRSGYVNPSQDHHPVVLMPKPTPSNDPDSGPPGAPNWRRPVMVSPPGLGPWGRFLARIL
ncbi:hypothetical protein CC80DRAFT_570981 [Byssothecium circinans]|uniref:Uncharacterized protein n=1 Tax=Byssothecium circinans TaxID=147558 RepID=A0A6A5TN25_9PLEO|nr:hypothetical protein CC80DRAFT_570981 [Byssothecium circinans]